MNKFALSLLLLTCAAPAFAVKPACADAPSRARTMSQAFRKNPAAAAQSTKDVYEAELANESSPVQGISPTLRALIDATINPMPLVQKGLAAAANPQSPESRREFAEILARLEPRLTPEKILQDMAAFPPEFFTLSAQQSLLVVYKDGIARAERMLIPEDYARNNEIQGHLDALLCDKFAALLGE